MEREGKLKVGAILSDMSMPILLLVLIIFFSIMSPNFFSAYNLTNILVQNYYDVLPLRSFVAATMSTFVRTRIFS